MPGSFPVRGRRASILTASALTLALLPAGAAHAASTPVITKVSPMQVEVGQVLTISGRGFRKGANKNIVAFKRSGKPAVFVKASTATTTKLKLTVPTKILPFLNDDAGKSGVRQFRLRVLAKRFGKSFTSAKLSPRVGPPGSGDPGAGGGGGGGTGTPSAPLASDCKAVVTSDTTDTDKDGLSDALEKKIGTNPCLLDSDADGIADGYEYESALDLNSRALPYAGKKPYPNPLDGSDATIDFDGDGLTMADEYQLSLYKNGGALPPAYSDGNQDTGGPTAANGSLLDMNNDGVLTDDEKDADSDGLGNWDESHGRLTIKWWAGVFISEPTFANHPDESAMAMSELSMTDPDSDGDGVIDGADDQDQDGYTNLDELDRHYTIVGGKNLWINPYNPCLPDPTSRVCSLHPPHGTPWAPFGPEGGMPPGPYPLSTVNLGPGPNRIPQVF